MTFPPHFFKAVLPMQRWFLGLAYMPTLALLRVVFTGILFAGLVYANAVQSAFAAQVTILNSVKTTASGSGASVIPSLTGFNIPAGKNRMLLVLSFTERDHCDLAGDNCTTTNTTGTGLSDNFARPSSTVYQITARATGSGGTVNKKNALTIGGTPSGDLRFMTTDYSVADAGGTVIPNTVRFSLEGYFIGFNENEINTMLGGATSGNVSISLPDTLAPKSAGDDAILMAFVFDNVDQSDTGIVRSGVGFSSNAASPGNYTLSAASLDAGQAPNDANDGFLVVGLSSLGLPTHNGGFNTMAGYTVAQSAVTTNSAGRYDDADSTAQSTEPNGFSASAQFKNGVTSSFSMQSAAPSTVINVGGLAPAFTISSDNADVSDAPSTYGSATHTISGIRLGASVDADLVSLQSVDATGDDTNGTDDENGVTLPAALPASSSTNVSVSVQSAAGYLNAWFDWNHDGDFLDSGEQVATERSVSVSTVSLAVTPPATAIGGSTMARFRVCTTTAQCNTPSGSALSGEVEDYVANVTGGVTLDYSDAPATYGSPSHIIVNGFKLGATAPDAETAAIPSANADGDDTTGDDEDAVTLPQMWPGVSTQISIPVAGAGGYLQAWFDWNGDGSFSGAGEQVVTNLQDATATGTADLNTASGTIDVAITPPSNAVINTKIFARFRWSTQSSIDATTTASNGEVEDYALTLIPQPSVVTCPVGTAGNGSGYASSGTGLYKNNIFWLDWSCGTVTTFGVGDSITKSWELSNGLVITGQLSNITAPMKPYTVGSWWGDKLDDLYGNVNPIGLSNASDGLDPKFKVTFSATFNGVTVPSDIIFADGEDAAAGEFISVTTSGSPIETLEGSGSLKAAFSADGKTVTLTDDPDNGGGTFLGVAENVTDLNVDLNAGGNASVAFGVVVSFDFGDAANTYPSTASHFMDVDFSGSSRPTTATDVNTLTPATFTMPALRLGTNLDANSAAIPSANADGDDLDGVDDEDAVTLPQMWTGVPTQISVSVAGAGGYLQAWIDWNKNSTFDAGEQIATDLTDGGALDTNTATGVITFNVTPSASAVVGSTVARFRWSTQSALTATATALNGEIEDYAATIQAASLDYGDAPVTYGAPSHTIVAGFKLGAIQPDAEAAAMPSVGADGDDLQNTDDEEGVTFTGLAFGRVATVTAAVSGTGGYLQGWVDWNGDGDFADTGEQVFTNITDNGTADTDSATGTIAAKMLIPMTSVAAPIARFRWSSTQNLTSTAAAADGEVEDYALTIVAEKMLSTGSCDGKSYGVGTNGYSVYEITSVGTTANSITHTLKNNAAFSNFTISLAKGFNNYVYSVPSAIISTVGQTTPIYRFDPSNPSFGAVDTGIKLPYPGQTGKWWISGATDPSGNLYFLLKDGSYLVKVDVNTNTVSTVWSTWPTTAIKGPAGENFGQLTANVPSNYTLYNDITFESNGNALISDASGRYIWRVRNMATTPVVDFVSVIQGMSGITDPQWINSGGVTRLYGSDANTPAGTYWLDQNMVATNVGGSTYSYFDMASCDFGAGPTQDFSDAPASYGSPSHTVISGMYLGTASPDMESAAIPPLDGTGDNVNGTDDETAVTFSNVTQGKSGVFSVVVNGTGGYLQSWIDYNGNGNFNDSGEKIAVNLQDNGPGDLDSTTGIIKFAAGIPANAVTTKTYARFRWSTTSNLNATNAASNGEVEDYGITITANTDTSATSTPVAQTCGVGLKRDFGTSAVPVVTLMNSVSTSYNPYVPMDGGLNDAQYVLTPKLTYVDDFGGAYSNQWHDAVDHTGNADGLMLMVNAAPATGVFYKENFTNLIPGVRYTFSAYLANARPEDSGAGDLPNIGLAVTPTGGGTALATTSSGLLPQSYRSEGLKWKKVTLVFVASATSHDLLLENNQLLGGTGNDLVIDDISFSLDCDYGDAPDTSSATAANDYSTLLANNGPNNLPYANFYLGSTIDGEPDADQSTNASGDDLTGTPDDEDGINMPASIYPQQTLTLTATTVGTGGYLQGWIDFNADGDFLDAGEQVVTDLQDGGTGDTDTASGKIGFPVTVPVGAVLGNTYARFRWSSTANVASTGSGGKGEVEDYQVTVTLGSLSGVVFEDINYGGGNGRDQITSSGVGINGAKVELYNSTGALVATTVTANNGTVDGAYQFSVPLGTYYVRVVSDSVNSTRAGTTGAELGVQTYRYDGATAVVAEIGGRTPNTADSVANAGTETLDTTTWTLSGGGKVQSVSKVVMPSATTAGIDFGFNFDTIVNTNDAGQGSLRQFILNSNLLANTGLNQVDDTADGATDPAAGVETSIFEIAGTGPFTINPTSALPSITGASTAIDATTQTGANCAATSRTLKVNILGASAGGSVNGLAVNASDVTIRGLAIGSFTASGINGTANADNLVVACNNLGLDADGSTLRSNTLHGLFVTGATNVTVGGSTTADRNILSGNARDGARIETVTTALFENNYVGTTASGTVAASNNREGASYSGIATHVNSTGITIRNNLVSGNDITSGVAPVVNVTNGIRIDTTSNTTMVGNLIGTTPDGLSALGNSGSGIYTFNASNITIGGTTAAVRNIISKNGNDGIKTNNATNGVTILGNYIGTDINGTGALGNVNNGIFLADSQNVVIGNSAASGRNIIAKNSYSGIRNSNTPGTLIKGNYIGSDVNGSAAMGNTLHGIYVQNSANVVVGGSATADGNVVVDNRAIGIFMVGATSNTRVENNSVGIMADNTTKAGNAQAGIETSATNGAVIHNNVSSGNSVRGIHIVNSPSTTITNNKVGVDVTGLLNRGNTSYGIDIETAATNLTVSGNIISANSSSGVHILGGNGTNNVLTNNIIGLASDGTTAFANGNAGVLLDGVSNVTVGGTAAGSSNTIASNTGDAIRIIGSGAKNNIISGNSTYANTGLGIDLDNNDVTLNDANDADSGTANDGLNFPQITGVYLLSGNLTVKGCAPSGAKVELFEADVSPSAGVGVAAGANTFTRTQDYGEGARYLTNFVEGVGEDTTSTPVDCATLVDADNNQAVGMSPFQWTISVPTGVVLNDTLTATATVTNTGTSEFSAAAKVIMPLDASDAPASYGIATHTLTTGMYLGAAEPDTETGIPSANADSDDTTGTADENGVTLPTFKTGQTAYVTVASKGIGGQLQAWIDWNGNGTFDSNEYIATNLKDNASGDLDNTTDSIRFAVSVPTYAVTTKTYARFRWSTVSDLTATAAAPDGEVEDYSLTVSPAASATIGACPVTVQGAANGATFKWPGTPSTVSVTTTNNWSATATSALFKDIENTTRPIVGTRRWDKAGDITLTLNFSTPVPANQVILYINDIGHSTSEAYNPKATFTVSGGATPADFTMESMASGATTLAYVASAGVIYKQVLWGTTREQGVLTGQGTNLVSQLTLTTSGIRSDDFVAYIVGANLQCDFGDAPDALGTGPAQGDYQTLWASSGAVHQIAPIPTVYLGTGLTSESDAIPNATATGDTDEGVVIPVLPQQQTVSIEATVNGTGGYLQGWIDWNQNGLFDAAEQIATNVRDGLTGDTDGVANGKIKLNVVVPSTATVGKTFARFRWSTTSSLTSTAVSDNGEVEDYQVTVLALDYADAPATYGVASHIITTGLKLGTTAPDSDVGAVPNATATGDNTTGTNDEDGVNSFPTLSAGMQSYSVNVTATNTLTQKAWLVGWIDFNGNGTFEASEAATVPVTAGSTSKQVGLTWSNVSGMVAGTSYVRLRLTTDSSIATGTANTSVATGAANDGEIEDYAITIEPKGASLSGTVYNDANVDGTLDTNETGIKAINVVLQNSTVCKTTTTNADGTYKFEGLADGNYTVYEVANEALQSTAVCPPAANDPVGYLSSTANNQAVTIAGSNVVNVNFGDVRTPSFTLDNTQVTVPNSTVVHPHVFRSYADGSVAFTVADETAKPSTLDWSTTLYLDSNCDAKLSDTDTIISAPISINAGDKVCILAKVMAPANATAGALYTIKVQGDFTYGADNLITNDVQARTDITTITAGSATDAAGGEGKLSLEKSVWNVTRNQSGETALPGETLRYTIRYENIGNGLLDELVVHDTVPTFTQLVAGSQACVTTPAEVTNCTPAVNDTALEWSFTGQLKAGSSGSVSYEVTVE